MKHRDRHEHAFTRDSLIEFCSCLCRFFFQYGRVILPLKKFLLKMCEKECIGRDGRISIIIENDTLIKEIGKKLALYYSYRNIVTVI